MLGKLGILLVVAAATFALPSPKETYKLIRSPSNNDLHGGGGHLLDRQWKDYDAARRQCWQYGYDFAELETKEEEEWILQWIYGKDYVDFVWVGGKWDGNSSYIWESELPLRNDTAWLPEEPSQRNEDSRVLLLANDNGIGLLTRPKTEKHSILCEMI